LSRNIKVKNKKYIILPVVFYGLESWSRTLREEHGLRVSEKKFRGEYLDTREMK
jgi:hypothetical protein